MGFIENEDFIQRRRDMNYKRCKNVDEAKNQE